MEERMPRSRKRQRRIIRKLVPMLVALVLIIIVIAGALVTSAVKKLAYSKDRADLNEYFKIAAPDEVAILMDNEYIEDKAFLKNDRYYIPMQLAEDMFCNDFYYDKYEELLLYTSANSTKRSTISDGDFLKKDDVPYLALDYLEEIASIDATIYEGEPHHIEIRYAGGMIKTAEIKKHTSVRILGGIKSDILEDLEKDDKVEILEEMEDWSKVKTANGMIGYVEKRVMSEPKETELEPPAGGKSLDIVHTLRDYKICLGWHQVMSQAANITINEVLGDRIHKGMNVISPTWFSISDENGNITNIGDTDYVQKAHSSGLEVWALCDNFTNNVNTYEVLSHTTRRTNLIANIVTAAVELGVDGINIDFETLTGETGDSFAQFIRELSIPCREKGLVLSVDNYVPQEYTAFYNRKAQGQFADYVVIMGYDEHFSGSEESGSVASFNFVQEGIEKTLQDVAPEQIINGVPFYTRIWTESNAITSEAVGMQTAKDFVSNHGMKPEWNDICAQNYAEKNEGSLTYKVWLEDAQSIKTKLDLMDANNLAGVACWKLGLETADVWDVIADYMSR